MQSVCLVIGAGAGIGGNVGKRFASEGYHAVLCRRTDEAGLDRLVKEIKDQGWEASGHLINAVEADSIENCVFKVEAEIGPIDVVVYNLGSQVGDRKLQETTYKTFELGWRMATFGLFRVASVVRRMLCQSLNAEFGAKGIHIAHILIDGSVDAPDTLGKMLGAEKFQELREARGLQHDGLMLPEKIADTYFHIFQQHRSTWTHEIDLRSFSDVPWWNH